MGIGTELQDYLLSRVLELVVLELVCVVCVLCINTSECFAGTDSNKN